MIKVGGPYPPVIWDGRAGSGSVWVEVPEGTTLKDIEWEAPSRAETSTVVRTEVYARSSAKPNEFYKVTIEDGKVVWCECYGWLYRRHCRHADQVTEALRRLA